MCKNTLLIVEPRDHHRSCLARMLGPCEKELLAVGSRTEALQALSTRSVSVVVTAPKLPDGYWQDFLSDTAPLQAPPNVVVMAPGIDRRLRSELVKCNGDRLLAEPEVGGDVKRTVALAIEDWVLRTEAAPVVARAAGAGTTGPGLRRGGAARLALLAVPHVLVVDNESMILELMSRILEPRGLVVSTAQSGYHAAELLQRHADISLAILDWRMPGMSGERVLDYLATIRPGIRTIVASSGHPPDVERAFYGRNVDSFVRKPFNPETLVRAVKTVLAA
jgi:CheY-like chemotaxis protein